MLISPMQCIAEVRPRAFDSPLPGLKRWNRVPPLRRFAKGPQRRLLAVPAFTSSMSRGSAARAYSAIFESLNLL